MERGMPDLLHTGPVRQQYYGAFLLGVHRGILGVILVMYLYLYYSLVPGGTSVRCGEEAVDHPSIYHTYEEESTRFE